ncbi:MAG: DUF952 domain-containing protein [Alphaproteobacteria bacterium]|nr:DUF952 domain-containing protein [Alphaproteobacteria bacterium]
MSDAEHPEATVYHLCRAPEWAAAERTGIFHGSPAARADGYLHFSTAAQVRESAARHRAGIADLVLVAAESAALGPALRWEPASGGRRPGLFPHLYGPLPLASVRGVFPLALGPDGRHVFPSHIP